AMSAERLAAQQLSEAGAQLAPTLTAQHLPANASKTHFLASTPCRGARAEGQAAAPWLAQVAGVRVDAVFKAGPPSGFLWGRAVVGIPDGDLRCMRIAARRSAERLPNGASLRLGLRAAEALRGRDLGPEVLAVGKAASMAPAAPQSGAVSQSAFVAEVNRATIGQRAATAPWAQCRAPIDALILALGRIGWGAGPTSETRELGRHASGRHGRPLFWGAIGELIGPCGPLGRSEKAAFASVFASAHWPQQRLVVAKERDRGSCLLCSAVIGTLFHRLFGCPALEVSENGILEATCHGTARADLCPQRTATGAEDFACWVLTEVAGLGRRVLRVDCASTVSCLRSFAVFGPEDYEVRKVQPRLTWEQVLEGRVSELDAWQQDLMVEAERGARRASDRRELGRHAEGGRHRHPILWDAIRELIGPRDSMGPREKAAFVSVLANAHWPQQRFLAAKERDRGSCLLCVASNGTLSHRLFGCPALEAVRKDSCSARLKRRAQRARQPGEAAAKDSARHWLPAPMLRPPGPGSDMAIRCFRKPDDGFLRGRSFLGGSALGPTHAATRRAGWAICQVSENGILEAACHGTARADLCPQRAAINAELFACRMLTEVAGLGRRVPRVDCAFAVSCLRRGLQCAIGAGRPGARLWSRFFVVFGPGDYEVRKVPARLAWAQVQEGRVLELKWRGSRACLRGRMGRRPVAAFDGDPSSRPAEAAATGSAPKRERSTASAATALGLGAGPPIVLGRCLRCALADGAGEGTAERLVSCSRCGADADVDGGRRGKEKAIRGPDGLRQLDIASELRGDILAWFGALPEEAAPAAPVGPAGREGGGGGAATSCASCSSPEGGPQAAAGPVRGGPRGAAHGRPAAAVASSGSAAAAISRPEATQARGLDEAGMADWAGE
ncbi:unnamed protein product, partial [Prorocentrum cordatum]